MAGESIQPRWIPLESFLVDARSRSYGAGDLDLAVIAMIEQVKIQDGQVRALLAESRLVAKAREIVGNRIAKLRAALAEYKRKSDDENLREKVALDTLKQESDFTKLIVSVDPESMTVVTGGDELMATTKVGRPRRAQRNSNDAEHPRAIDGNTIDEEIKRLESMAQQLDSDREIKMIELNSSIGKRANIIQWLSNMARKKNEAQGGIINNLR